MSLTDRIFDFNKKVEVILVGPNPNPKVALGGVSSVVSFIISNNNGCHYIHFEQGSRDKDKGGYHKITRVIKRYRQWKNLLAENNRRIIHYNFDLSPFSILRDYPFMRLARKMNRKMVIHVHGGMFMTSPKVPFVYMLFLKKIFSWEDIPFIVLSAREKKTIESRYGTTNIHVLPNSVALPERANKILNNASLNIGYFGRITATKGIQELFNAAIKLKENKVPFKMLFAGKKEQPTDYVDLFSNALGDNFQYVGVVSGQQKDEFLRTLDVFALPSYFEGLPMSLLESMSYGIIPVATAVGSIPEVVSDGMNGLLIKDHDDDSIVTAIKKIIDDKELAISMSINAREEIEKRFNPQKYCETLNAIYNKLQA